MTFTCQLCIYTHIFVPNEEEEHKSVTEHRQNPDNDEEHET